MQANTYSNTIVNRLEGMTGAYIRKPRAMLAHTPSTLHLPLFGHGSPANPQELCCQMRDYTAHLLTSPLSRADRPCGIRGLFQADCECIP